MGLFVLGLNHKESPVEVREQFHFTPSQLEQALKLSLDRPEFRELLILSTCNRVEFYGYSDEADVPREALLNLFKTTHLIEPDLTKASFYAYTGKQVTRHLFRVAAGLDSLVVGENEILGQLREAYHHANQAGSIHSLLYKLVEKALKSGKDVRTKTKINQGAVSIPSAAVELAQKIFGKLDGEKVLVLGTGEMSLLTLKTLKSCGANIKYIVSRDKEKGEALARDFNAERLSIKNWDEHLGDVDILITSTSAPHPIVTQSQIKECMKKRRHRPLFLIDIAVPRDVEASVNSLDNVYLYNVDDLKSISASNLRQRRGELGEAEHLIEQAVVDYQGWLERLKARPTLERFESFVDEVLGAELERLARGGIQTEENRAEACRRIRQKLLHPPQERIKDAARNGGVTRYLEALDSLFNLKKD